MNNARHKKQFGNPAGQNIQVMYKRGGKNMVDVTALIRSIQRTEGNPDCFRGTEKQNCRHKDCAWWMYCMQG